MPDGSQAASPLVREILAGLSQPQKTLPAKLFYDAEGCRLFGEITRLPEYYVTRTELALLARVAAELPRRPGCALVEYGASDEAKAMALIDAVGASAYVPIDIAPGALQDMAARLAQDRPGLGVHPIAADFLGPLALPDGVQGRPVFGFFPGSTIGNLDPAAATGFLRQAAATLGRDALFLVGVDLRKSPDILLPAYDDAQGVTAAFNRNLLAHVNRITGGDFDAGSFTHGALWNEAAGRIEMHLRSAHAQTVRVAGLAIAFAAGETIHTENSYKHTVEGFAALAGAAEWASRQVWTDEARLFSLHLLASGG